MRFASSSCTAAVVLALFACGSAPADTSGTANDEIVNVPQSSVKNQTISNCWLYATLGWA
jgi:hypothetical protein